MWNLSVIFSMLYGYLSKLVLAAIALYIGLRIVKWVEKKIVEGMEKKDVELSIRSFVASLAGYGLKILLFLAIAGMLGFNLTTFAAVLAGASLAVGLALQGSLSNFAGGVLILLLKPFRVGDFIDATGYMGTVEDIHIFYTRLVTPDNTTVIIPNGDLSNASLKNFSMKEKRRLEMKFGVGYEDDIKKVQSVLTDIVLSHPLVLKDIEPFVRLSEHGDSAIIFTVRIWTQASDYWAVYFDIMETVKLRFDEENISFPFPQMDVHLDQ